MSRRSPKDFDAEIQSHLELEADQLKAEGYTDEEAHRRARVGFGSIPAARESFYERGHVIWLENLLRDFRFALRGLRKNWRFSLLAILALSLGIGAATVIFSAIYGVVLNTFPFSNPEQVTSFGIQDLSSPAGGRREFLSMPEFLAFRQQSHAFSDISALQLAKIYPQQYPKRFTVTADRLSDRVTGPFKNLILPLLAAVLMLLLIACSNVANLILARATAREKELAVRGAMGASGARIVQQFLMESFVLAAVGCIVGCALAWLGIKAILPIIPYNDFPQEAVITLNPVVLLWSLGITLFAVLACSAVPAARALRGNLQSRLIAANTGSSSQPRHGKGRAALVIVEVALSIVLLIGTGLMARTFLALTNVDLGFNPDHVLTANLALPVSEFKDAAARNRFVRTFLDRVGALPGVDSATTSFSIPPHAGAFTGLTIQGRTHSERWTTALDLVGEGYFRTLDYQLLRGRLFTPGDIDQAHRYIVVNHAFAQRFLGGDDPVGHMVQFTIDFSGKGDSKSAQKPSFEIIGMVGDEKNDGLANKPQPEAFLPHTVLGPQGFNLLVGTAGSPTSLIPTIRHLLWTLDPNVALGDAGTVRSILQRDTFASPRFQATVLGAFALIGTLLVVIGIYSVMAYTVSLCTHEMGVRMAMGARPGDILRLVMGKGLVLIGIGVALGIAGSIGLMRYLAHLVWGVPVLDPWTYGIVTVCVVAVGLAACFAPARRAARVDPSVALRYD